MTRKPPPPSLGVQAPGVLGLLKQTFSEISSDRVLVLSASLSYFAALSLAPLVVVTLGLVGMIADREEIQEHVATQVEGLLGPQSEELFTQIAVSEEASGGSERRGLLASIAGVVTLLFGATAVFVQLQDGLNVIWDVEPAPGHGLWRFVRQRLVSLAMVMSLGFLLLVSLLASTALTAATTWLSDLTGAEAAIGIILQVAVSLIGSTVLLALLFHNVPDARTAWPDVWLGAGITAVLFTFGEWAIGQYLGRAGVGSAYGAAGSLVVLLVWVYYSSLIVFAGAEFTQVYATRRGSGITPEKHARRGNDAASRAAPRRQRAPARKP
jgi:membrane protein